MIELVHSLRRVCNHLDDVRGITLVGMDGLVVEELQLDPLTDLSTLAAELSVVLKGLGETVSSCSMGQLENLQIGTEEGVILVQGVGSEYFFMLVLKPGGNSGRGRFYLQLEADRVATEI